MNLNEMSVSEMEARLAAIGTEIESDDADLDALEAETRSIKDEMEARKAAEAKRNEIREAVANGKGTEIETFEEKGIKNTMTNVEVRSSREYIDAFAQYLRTENDAECRALLTENVSGSVPVPVFVEGIIAEAYKASPIMSRVRKVYAKGNVKVGFEVSAPIAEFHTEGDDPIDAEELVLGIVTLVPGTLKKFVEISDESIDLMTGESYVRYIYSEISRKIVKAEEKAVIDAILAAPQTATTTSPSVQKFVAATKAVTDFIDARALLTADASDLVIICTPTDYATYKGLAIGAGFAFDPFEGITVLFSDYATAPIIGDLSGVMANYPNGDEIQFKYDDRTLMTSDMVRILGRKPVAIGVVVSDYFTKITAS